MEGEGGVVVREVVGVINSKTLKLITGRRDKEQNATCVAQAQDQEREISSMRY